MSGALVPWRSSFLSNLRATGGNVTRSAELAGVTRFAVYKRAAKDAPFRRAFLAVLGDCERRRGKPLPKMDVRGCSSRIG